MVWRASRSDVGRRACTTKERRAGRVGNGGTRSTRLDASDCLLPTRILCRSRAPAADESGVEVPEEGNLKYLGFESQDIDSNPNMFILKTKEIKSKSSMLGQKRLRASQT